MLILKTFLNLRIEKINKLYFYIKNSKDLRLLILRVLPSYFMFYNHGLSKISSPDKWQKYGNLLTKYFYEYLDFINPFFGFMASFSESICALLVLLGFFTRIASGLLSFTMLTAALHHITGTGSPENALIYFSIFIFLTLSGPGKYSLEQLFSKKLY